MMNSMTTHQSPVRIDKALEAAQAMADALHALNKAGGGFASDTNPVWQATQGALLTTLKAIFGHYHGQVILTAHVETGDSIRLVAERLDIAPIAR